MSSINYAAKQVFAGAIVLSFIISMLPFTVAAQVVEDAPVCTIIVASNDSGDVPTENGVQTFVHNAWTKDIIGAQWLWSDALVVDTTINQTETFTQNFIWGGDTIANIDFQFAADNGYVVELNGTEIGSGSTANNNHSSVTQLTVDPADVIVGENTLSFEITNLATPANTNPENNPAGFAFKMIIDGTGTNCDELPPVIETVTVSGTKWDDIDGNGVRGESEPGLSGVTMTISGPEGFTASTVTDEYGEYFFNKLLPDLPYTVCEVVPEGSVQTSPEFPAEDTRMVSCGENGAGYTITPYVGHEESDDSFTRYTMLDFGNYEEDFYTIFGFVWEDSNADDVKAGDEAPIANVVVTATNVETSEILQDETDVNGRYEINLPAGTWRVAQQVPTEWTQLSAADIDGTYTVTVPSVPVIIEDESVSFFDWLLPTAHAAILESGYDALNFGNQRVLQEGSSSNGGTRVGSRSGGSSSGNAPSGSVLGVATSTPTVLGEATSVMPVGAPNTGAGGTAPVTTSLPTLLAVLTTAVVTRKTK